MFKHTYFISWIVPKPEIIVGNATISTKLKGVELLKYAITEIQNKIPDAIIMSIYKLD